MKYLLANRIFMLQITSFLILLYRYCEKADQAHSPQTRGQVS